MHRCNLVPLCVSDCYVHRLGLFYSVQVTVWGDYGRSDRKVFMGVVQIKLDSLDLASMAIGWYKLFSSLSLVSAHTPAAASGSSAAAAASTTASTGSAAATGLLQRASSSSSRS